MRTLRLDLEYDGSCYWGWQYQPDGPTIQGAIEACLRRILGTQHRIHGAGRTDAGVHARGQVAHFMTEHGMAPDTLHRALNATLPRDIGVHHVSVVHPGFHSRKSARAKRYTYQILNRRHRSVFLDRFSWHINGELDIDAMMEAMRWLLGEHEFSAFCATDCEITDRVRHINDIGIYAAEQGLWRIGIEGNGFLRHMVRIIVGTLVDVGNGKLSPDEFRGVVESRDRRQAGRTAPARGLCLEWVQYDEPSSEGA